MKAPEAPRTFASRAPVKGGRALRRRALYAGLVLAPLALFSSAYSLAVATDTRQPQFSQQFYRGLPKAKAQLGDMAIANALSDPATSAAQQSADLARNLPDRARAMIDAKAMSALIDTPYAAGALRQLAFLEGDPERRHTLLLLARQITRRDVGAAAQMAELQFLDGEFAQGLATLDQALVISASLDERIFPLMLRASQNREFAGIFRNAIAADPAWGERLARHASKTPASAPYFAAIADSLPSDSRGLSLDYGAPLVAGLVAEGRASAAFAAYAAYSGGGQDPSAFGTRPLAPLDWQLIDRIEVGARLIGTSDKVAEVFAGPRRSGEVAQILLRLPRGRHRLALLLADLRGSGAKLHLARTCMTDGAISETSTAAAVLTEGLVELAFDVDERCAYQFLRLEIKAGAEPFSALVENVAIEQLAR